MNWMQKIRACFEFKSVLYSRHAKVEMELEEFGRIFEHEVYEAVCSGEVIEEYLDDKPYSSTLIYGRTTSNRPLHVVCAYNVEENLSNIITVYHPDPELWIDYKRRKKP